RQAAQQFFQIGVIRLLAVQATREIHSGPDGFKHADGNFLRYQAYFFAHGSIVTDQIQAIDLYYSVTRIYQSAKNADQCGLASTVWPQQGKNFSATDVQADIAQRLESGRINLVQVLDRNNGVRHKSGYLFLGYRNVRALTAASA